MITFDKIGSYGRMGNQLFQYAALKSLSLTKNYQLVLPLNQHVRLHDFNLRVHYANFNTSNFNVYREKSFNYDNDFLKNGDNTTFEGYYQTEKYFKNIDYVIRREFTLKNQNIVSATINTINKIRNKYPKQKVTAFHIRRGDNVPSESNHATQDGAQFRTNKEDYHPLLSQKYIDYCLEEFQDDIKLVFSDSPKDIQWCKDNMRADNLHFIGGNNDLFDFQMMQLCDNLCISNSSFSWWAAWLNKSKDKRVLAPKKWFGKVYENHDLSDLFPETWEIVSE